jgi:hypothetical protein
MAKMIPDIDPTLIENTGERLVYQALRDQLPSNWVVRHHYLFCWKDGNRMREGEADFIVLAPKRGLMVIEVKGSHGFDCKDGQWFRVKEDGHREPAENPFEQALTVKHRLVTRIARKVFGRAKEEFPGIYGHLVVYPKGKIEGALPSSVDPCIMVAYKDMDSVAQRLENGFDEWGGDFHARQLSPEDMQKIVGFLSEEMEGVPVFAASADEDEEQIEQITQLQFRAFRGLLRGDRVHIMGPAGSGKTLLARWTADLLEERGERTLLTCYNTVLAEWLRESTKGKPQPQISSFFSLCRNIIVQAKLPFSPPSGAEEQKAFWRTKAPSLFVEAITSLSPEQLKPYDAIIVDEAQDFHPDWWLPLMLMLKDPDAGRLCIFSDPDQRGTFGLGESWPKGLFPYELQDNCRNTKKIATYCGNIIEKRVKTMPLLPEGSSPRITAASEDPKDRARTIKQVYGQLIDQGFDSSRIAILSPFKSGNEKSSFTYLPKMHALPLRGGEDDVADWKSGQCIWASTIKKFKGLEADCIILTDCSESDFDKNGISQLYVGATRAKHQLVVIPCNSATQHRFESLL